MVDMKVKIKKINIILGVILANFPIVINLNPESK